MSCWWGPRPTGRGCESRVYCLCDGHTTHICGGFYFPDTSLCLLHEQRHIVRVIEIRLGQHRCRTVVRTFTLIRLPVRVCGCHSLTVRSASMICAGEMRMSSINFAEAQGRAHRAKLCLKAPWAVAKPGSKVRKYSDRGLSITQLLSDSFPQKMRWRVSLSDKISGVPSLVPDHPIQKRRIP